MIRRVYQTLRFKEIQQLISCRLTYQSVPVISSKKSPYIPSQTTGNCTEWVGLTSRTASAEHVRVPGAWLCSPQQCRDAHMTFNVLPTASSWGVYECGFVPALKFDSKGFFLVPLFPFLKNVFHCFLLYWIVFVFLDLVTWR